MAVAVRDIHIKVCPLVRNRVLGKLRMRGTTMQAFVGDLFTLLAQDDGLLEFLETRRQAMPSLALQRAGVEGASAPRRAGRPPRPV
jgi:hypothetical protein